MKKKVISLFMVIALSMTAGAQTQVKEHRRSITLDEAIVIARTQSVDAAVALNELKTAYWEYACPMWWPHSRTTRICWN